MYLFFLMQALDVPMFVVEVMFMIRNQWKSWQSSIKKEFIMSVTSFIDDKYAVVINNYYK